MDNLCVLIMAAGKGTRMKSATPKVLQPILDRPIIDYVISSVLKAGTAPQNIGVLVGSGGELVEAHISQKFPEVNILWQREQLGTGHAVKSARQWWGRYKSMLVLNGDVPLLLPESISELASSCEEYDCTVITFLADYHNEYGRIIRRPDSVSIVEYKDATAEQRKIHEVNAGCYAFRVKSLDAVIGLITNNNVQHEYYLPDALKIMNEHGMNTGAFPLPEEEMQGVNNQAELAKVTGVMRERIILHWMSEGVRIVDPANTYISADAKLARDVVIMPNVQIWGNSTIGEGCYIGSGSILTNATLGRNVQVIAYAVIENSELKDNSKAGPFCYIRDGSCLEENAFAGKFVELKKSHIGERSKVPHLSYMGDAELGHDVNIGAGSITCNYDGQHKHQTHIGSNCFIGSNTMFVAPVEVEDGSATAAGSVITFRVPEDSLGVGRARQKNISGWSSRHHKPKSERE
ncbi:MAG: bifunctional UDP-N-acetylglucosamine diphosphorylase/glucosamine-1-phosphate N-acetyltransferase GlmU [Synergistaceae bacterium]|nr:bifunctional UDP-N-acetylglucosamine diphosphorylase/glucosamine-1-phosphate N-acetyltransferase GlmU [Synergistaceae bacterium]